MCKDILFLSLTCFKPPSCKVGISRDVSQGCRVRDGTEVGQTNYRSLRFMFNYNFLPPKQATSCS